MTWFKISLTDEAVAGGGLGTITDAFEKALPLGNDTNGCALFTRDVEDGLEVFISPIFAAAVPNLLEEFSAAESNAPPPNPPHADEYPTSLLLATDQNSAWALLG